MLCHQGRKTTLECLPFCKNYDLEQYSLSGNRCHLCFSVWWNQVPSKAFFFFFSIQLCNVCGRMLMNEMNGFFFCINEPYLLNQKQILKPNPPNRFPWAPCKVARYVISGLTLPKWRRKKVYIYLNLMIKHNGLNTCVYVHSCLKPYLNDSKKKRKV